ncbi:MAG TPA: oligosaccharide repeat unit polymerase, partial [Gemmatimonadaceae bacterium]
VYSFSVIRPLLTRLGMISFQPWSLLSYYETPYRTNVYTVFGPYVLDFGILGSILWLSLFGFISGLIHGLRIRYRHIPYLAFLSALSLTLLTLGVFYDYYTSAGYVWLSLIFSTLLFPRELPDEKSLAVFGGLPARRNAGGSIIPDTALV